MRGGGAECTNNFQYTVRAGESGFAYRIKK